MLHKPVGGPSFRILLWLTVILLGGWLAGCAPAARPVQEAPAADTTKKSEVVQETQVVEKIVTVEVEKEVEKEATKAAEATQAPAAAEADTPPAPSATPVAANAAPGATARPLATAVQPEASPAARVEARLVELEYPAALRLGDSDIIRLALVPWKEGYVVQAEFPEHEVVSQTVAVARPGGYELSAAARLDGVGFDFSPAGDQEQSLPPDQAVAWRWSLTPRAAGQQRLSLTLTLHWTPSPGVDAAPRQVVVYSRGLEIRVLSFFGLTRSQAMAGGFVSLFFGGGLGLAALFIGGGAPRKVLQPMSPNPALALEPRAGLSLANHERALLAALFQRYARLALESEFLSGYSGARTFLALPIRPDGRADAYTIVKIGPAASIEQEYQNYERFVKDTLPPVTARIQHPPITLPSHTQAASAGLAAMQYTFIGAPGKQPRSLRQALLEEGEAGLLDKLFETFGPNWWMQRRPYTFRLAQEYDRMLPAHLVIEPASGHGEVLNGALTPASLSLAAGQIVNLKNFRSIEAYPDGRSLALRGAPLPGQPPLRIRWQSTADPNGASGRVVATRVDLLRGFTRGMDLLGLPDPIERLPALLNETLSGTQSAIHGDLNLENILVGPGGFVWLIDFAQTRDGHTLYDFAHLQADLIAHVLAAQIADPRAYLEASAAHPLLTTLEAIAARCLFNPGQPREYHLALCLTCLGALKYANLDTYARYLLYLTAARLGRVVS